MEKNITQLFVDDLYELSLKDIPEQVLKQTKRCLLDYIGVTLFGSYMLEPKTRKLLSLSGKTIEDTTIIGLNRKSDIYNTIFINGLNAHAADFDDGTNSGIIHLGSPIISAILPAAQKEGISAKKTLLGIIIGYEAALRLAKTIQPHHKARGYHASATCGCVGAAAGLCIALGLDKKVMKDAMSCACVSAGGLLKVLEDGSDLKPFNIARASMLGAISVNMARAGFLGPDDVLSGNTGFLEVLSNKMDLSKLEIGGNDTYAVMQVYFKPYAACRYCHPAIESALNLRGSTQIEIEKIKEINVETYYWAVNKHEHSEIKGITSAKMSTPYSVAVALIFGKANISEFSDERIRDGKVLSLAKKVFVRSNEKFTSDFPAKSTAKVQIIMTNGDEYTSQTDFPKGEPENPLSDEELIEKFKSLIHYAGKTEDECDKIIEYVLNSDSELDELFVYLA